MTSPIRWVCFDVGETLFDETGLWDRWADYLAVPRLQFRAELVRIIGRGEHHRGVFEAFRPGFDLQAAMAERLAREDDPGFRTDDLFADVRPCLEDLQRAGVRIGVAGNTSVLTEHAVAHCGLPIAFIASSQRWKVDKPAPEFFVRLAEACGAEPAAIAYVGDRLDNDVLPAKRAGMTGVWLRRGLWAEQQRGWPASAEVQMAINSLAELPNLLAQPS